MESIRKWFYKPKKGDRSLLAQFFYADDELNAVAAELDSFDGKKDPQRCTALVNHLRQCQDKVLTICIKIMDELIPGERASRDFRVKFPDDVIQDNLAGQLWFGAECLSAGSSIMNRESESGAMRPLARALTKSLEKVRGLLRDASLCGDQTPPCFRNLISCLCTFDHLLAEFELRYVSAMVPVKTAHEYELQQLVVVLFSETLQRALARGLLTQDMVDDYDPALMFTIPRLAIVSGLLFYPYMSPLSLDQNATNMSDMFRPFRSLLMKIRELLLTLSEKELSTLERMLCSSDEVKFDEKLSSAKSQQPLSSQETSDDDDNDEDDDDDDGNDEDDDDDEDSECLSSSTAELVMDNNNVVAATIEHCGTKGGFPPPPQDLMNNNSIDGGDGGIPSTKHRPFVSPATVQRNDQLHKSAAPTAASDNNNGNGGGGGDECGLLLESSTTGPAPDVVLTESLATATEALTEILVKPAAGGRLQDANGNDAPSPQPDVKRHPNVSSSSTQTECTPSSSYRVCCCKEWNCWKAAAADNGGDMNGGGGARCNGQCGQPSSTRPCCHHHRRKKVNGGGGNTTATTNTTALLHDKTATAAGCECGAVSSKYSKSWRELRKSSAAPSAHNKRPGSGPTVICRFQSCTNNRSSSKPPVIKKHEMCSSCSSYTTSSADESDESVTDSTSTDSSCNYSLRRQKARAKFRSDEDLLHRLFVCISGVADQLQTNFAGDLRNILKAVFLMSNSSCSIDSQQNTEVMPVVNNTPAVMIENGEEALVWRGENIIGDMLSTTAETPPPWVPDNEAPVCMSCKSIFTVVRRRHHCRNCGKVFCSRCSSNSVPLPRFGHLKPVRVCNRCFIYQVTPFSLEPSIGPVPIVMQS